MEQQTIPFTAFTRIPSSFMIEPIEGYYEVNGFGVIFLSALEVLAMRTPDNNAFVLERVQILGGEQVLTAPWRVVRAVN